MLIAYLDEIGEPGAFVSKDHPRFNTNPVFGYAGFVLPDGAVRDFGRIFTAEKRRVFSREIAEAEAAGQRERKGSDIFTPDAWSDYPAQIRVFRGLISKLFELGGRVFYYADEKEKGTARQVRMTRQERERNALTESVNHLCRHADRESERLLILMDQVNENHRCEQVQSSYAHIFARSREFPEMRAVIEPPMHVDSKLSADVQFADWVAAAINRAIDRQLVPDSRYMWIPEALRRHMTGTITNESKLHLWQSSLSDFNHIGIFKEARPVVERLAAASMSSEDLRKLAKVKHAAQKARLQ